MVSSGLILVIIKFRARARNLIYNFTFCSAPLSAKLRNAEIRLRRQAQSDLRFPKRGCLTKEVRQPLILAEQEGFEPSVSFGGTHDFQM